MNRLSAHQVAFFFFSSSLRFHLGRTVRVSAADEASMTDERFKIAQDQYFQLRGQLAAGRITRDQFLAALAQLSVRDSQGRALSLIHI